MRSTAALSSLPIMMVRLAASAPFVPPDTGASTSVTPRVASVAASSRVPAGSDELMSMTIAPGLSALAERAVLGRQQHVAHIAPGRQHGDDGRDIAAEIGERRRRAGLVRCRETLLPGAIEVVDGNRKLLAGQVAGHVPAHGTDPDESDGRLLRHRVSQSCSRSSATIAYRGSRRQGKDQSMREIKVGDVSIVSIIERDGPWRTPEAMFPAFDPVIGHRHLKEMDPVVFDAQVRHADHHLPDLRGAHAQAHHPDRHLHRRGQGLSGRRWISRRSPGSTASRRSA